MNIYLVGGGVRDSFLGLQNRDLDYVVVGSSVEELTNCGFKQIGKSFPVFLHPETNDEYALARREKKAGHGHTDFETDTSHVTLEEDLSRRDLTINAIAREVLADGELGKVIDPYCGQHDLVDGILRHVSPAFKDDPLRVFRVARFAATLGFDVAPETMSLMRSMKDELKSLSGERVWKETEKALKGDHFHRYVEVLFDCGALEVWFPELYALHGVQQPIAHHPEVDTFAHVIMSLKQLDKLTNDPVTKFAVLTHDLGKALSPKETLPAHHGHEQAGKKLVNSLCERLKVPNEYRYTALAVCEYHTHVHRWNELKPKTKIDFFQNTRTIGNKVKLLRILDACEADARGRLGFENRAYDSPKQVMEDYHKLAALDYKTIAEGKKHPKDAVVQAQVRALK